MCLNYIIIEPYVMRISADETKSVIVTLYRPVKQELMFVYKPKSYSRFNPKKLIQLYSSKLDLSAKLEMLGLERPTIQKVLIAL